MKIKINHNKLSGCPFSTVFISSVLFLAVLSSCVTLQINSDWKTDNVMINGDMDEWRGRLYYIEDENFSLGVRNDSHNLFLCLTAENQSIGRMILAQGLTFWFDPNGGNAKVFGVRYPTGRPENHPERQPGTEEERGEFLESRGQRTQEDRERFFNNMLKEAVLLGPKEGAETQIPVEELEGIELKIDAASGLFVYELKVPLVSDENFPFAIGVLPGQTLGIGIEIPKMDMSAMRGRMPPGGDMGGRGGMGGGMPPGGMRGRGGMPGSSSGRPGIMNGMKFWVEVKLAEPE